MNLFTMFTKESISDVLCNEDLQKLTLQCLGIRDYLSEPDSFIEWSDEENEESESEESDSEVKSFVDLSSF